MHNLLPYFQELNRYFDHVYIMTIHRATERHEKLKKVLEGFEYELLFGADNKEFSIEELKKNGVYDEEKAKSLHRYGKVMNPGMLGCTISHKMCYEAMIRDGHDRVLIFEDDILPEEEGLRLFPQIIKELPADWGMLYFDYDKNIERPAGGWLKQQFYHIQKLLGGITYSHTTINNLYSRPYSPHLRKAGYHDFGSAYAITRGTAKKLIELQTPIAFWSDHLLAYVSSNNIVNAYLTVPKLFVQESQFNKAVVGSYAEEQ
ncbi:MAG: glycosyltransferase family 25 protein [Gemmatimonadaceae bacterium]|nr:glycosyltransferase family 25 protein [Chitinophagaceae bacterium]